LRGHFADKKFLKTMSLLKRHIVIFFKGRIRTLSDKVLLAAANPALSSDKGEGGPPSLPLAASPVRPSLKGPGQEVR